MLTGVMKKLEDMVKLVIVK